MYRLWKTCLYYNILCNCSDTIIIHNPNLNYCIKGYAKFYDFWLSLQSCSLERWYWFTQLTMCIFSIVSCPILSQKNMVDPKSHEGQPRWLLKVTLPPWWAWRSEHQTKGDCSWALRSEAFALPGFGLGPVTSLLLPCSPFVLETSIQCLPTIVFWKNITCHRFTVEDSCLKVNRILNLTHIWFRWHLGETLSFTVQSWC